MDNPLLAGIGEKPKPKVATGTKPAPPSPRAVATPRPLPPPTNPMDTAGPSNPLLTGKPPAEMPIAPISRMVGTAIGKALDAQGHAVRQGITHETDTDAQMKKIRHAIPGMDWLYTAREPNTGIPFLDHIQDVANHASQGLLDATIQQVLDPLTYETAGLNKVRDLGLLKPVGAAALRAISKHPISRMVYDALHWGGEVTRERGVQTADTIRGASNRASAMGARAEQHINARVANIIDGRPIKNPITGHKAPGVTLDSDERLRVGQALNGEADVATLTPREQTAYRQLRTLTNLDYRLRRQTATAQAIRQYGRDLTPEQRTTLEQAFNADKEPPVPEPSPRTRKYYGEPQPRARTVQGPPTIDPQDAWVQHTTGLGPLEKALVGKSLTQPHLFRQLSDDLKARSQSIQDSLKAKYSSSANSTRVPLKPQARYTFRPENAEEVAAAEKVRDVYRTIEQQVDEKVPRRENYMPFTHSAEEQTEGREAMKVNPTEYFDLRTKQRDELKVTSPAAIENGFKAMAANTNRQVTTKAIHDSLGELLDDPKINKLFEETLEAKGNKRTDAQHLKDLWLGVVGYPRAAVVSFTPRHAANILDLLANTVPATQIPQAMKDTMALARKLITASPKEYYALTKEGRNLGALSGNYRERAPFMQMIPEWVPGIGGKSTGPLGAWTRLNNKLVWAVDEAAKQTYAKMLAASGEASGLEAGGMAAKRLVDYEHLSPLQKGMRLIAPFGTFRGGIPGAVLGGVARNPARAAWLNRLTGGRFYGDQPQSGQAGWSLSLPTAEVGRAASYSPGKGATPRARLRNLVSGPGNFVRSSIGAPVAGAEGALQDVLAPSVQPPRWAMYSQPWLPKRLKNGHLDMGFLVDSALAGVPEAQTLLEALGMSHFQWRGLGPEAARQTFGVNVNKPAPLSTLPPGGAGGASNPLLQGLKP